MEKKKEKNRQIAPRVLLKMENAILHILQIHFREELSNWVFPWNGKHKMKTQKRCLSFFVKKEILIHV